MRPRCSAEKPCAYDPGKFEGEGPLTMLAHWHAGNGGADATTGDQEVVDWFRAPLGFDADREAIAFAGTAFCEACIEAALDDARTLAGVAYAECSRGFAYLTRFETRAEFDAALSKADAQEDDDA